MATTKHKIYEQIAELLKSRPTISQRVSKENIIELIGQVSNTLLKADHFAVNVPEGDTIPNHCSVYEYDSVAVTQYKTTKSRAELPFIPMSLPRNMGVLHVGKTDDLDCIFVPVPPSTYGIIKVTDIIDEDSTEIIPYEVVGKYVVFQKDITALSITEVYMRLVGLNMSELGVYDILPLSADLESKVIETVFNLVANIPPDDRKIGGAQQ